jgi:hypothetical protein
MKISVFTFPESGGHILAKFHGTFDFKFPSMDFNHLSQSGFIAIYTNF